MRPASVSICAALLAAACAGREGAGAAVEDFAHAIADSSWEAAWGMITPESRQWYDSTVVILGHFGYAEAAPALEELAGGMTEEEFETLTGRDLFVRMIASSETAGNLSTSIRSVDYRDSTLAVVVVRTDEGPQEIPVRLVDGEWLIDIVRMSPPAGEE